MTMKLKYDLINEHVCILQLIFTAVCRPVIHSWWPNTGSHGNLLCIIIINLSEVMSRGENLDLHISEISCKCNISICMWPA